MVVGVDCGFVVDGDGGVEFFVELDGVVGFVFDEEDVVFGGDVVIGLLFDDLVFEFGVEGVDVVGSGFGGVGGE